MKKFAVIGLGQFGRQLALSLALHGHKVVAVDRREEPLAGLGGTVHRTARLDATDLAALRSEDIHKVDAAVVAMGRSFEAGVRATVALKELGVPRVISRALDGVQARILRRLGADQTINPDEESAARLGYSLSNPNLFEYVALTEGHSLVQIKAPEAFHNKTLGQIDLRKKYKVNLVAIRKQVSTVTAEGREASEQQVIDVPMANTVIRPSDTLVLVGATESLARLPQ